MNDRPAILIEFDPDTWQPAAVFFKAATDEQTDTLKSFLIDGLQTAAKDGEKPKYAA